MFALVMSEDRVSLQPRRREIIEGLKKLPGKSCDMSCDVVQQVKLVRLDSESLGTR